MKYSKREIGCESFISLKDYSKATSVEEIGPAVETTLNETFTSNSGYDRKWLLNHHYALPNRNIDYNNSPGVSVSYIDKCILTQPNYELMLGNKIMWESFHSKFAMKTYLFNKMDKYEHIAALNTVTLKNEGPLFIMPHRWYMHNYYHWSVETLPKLEVYFQLKKRIRGLKLLIHKFKNGSFQSQWLSILGISKDECVYIDEESNYYMTKVIYCPTIGTNHANKYSTKMLRKLMMRVQRNKDWEGNSDSQNIFISRKPGSVRSIINHPEIEEIMRLYRFSTVYSEDLSVIQQLKLFSKANCVCGVHGSGLSNMFSMQRKMSILEVITPTMINPCFYDLACSLELEYGFLVGRYDNCNREKQMLYLNPMEFEDQLKNMVEKAK